MGKTGQQIEDDVYRIIKESSIAENINGDVYKYGMRPRDSKKEDAVVKFVTGYDGDIQSGTVVINIYVPDVDPYADGVLVRDITRCTELEVIANEWIQSFTVAKSDYKFRLTQTIYTLEEPNIQQHFVTMRLKFRLPTF